MEDICMTPDKQYGDMIGFLFSYLFIFFYVGVYGHQRLPLCWHQVKSLPPVELQNGYVD